VAPAPESAAGHFLDPAILASIATMELRARTVVEGLISGLHRSPYRGFSVEFAEYRQYLQGDDPSTIDWKVYARSDRYYVKKFEEETNVECHLLLDMSASMGYASGAVSKLAYGTYLAAALAYLMNRQRDAVGLVAFDDRIVTRLPALARPGHVHGVFLALERVTVGQRSRLLTPLTQVADALVKRSMAIVISDLLDDPFEVVKGLRHLRFRGTDVVVFQVLDKDELTFPFSRAARFRDLETDDEVLAAPATVRAHYLKEVRDLIAGYERELRLEGIDYLLLDTSQPLEHALMKYLATRARRGGRI
jgi:uncharacterized protein (DUF58 family)